VFLSLSTQHLELLNQWDTPPPPTQIGGGVYSGGTLLPSYTSNWEGETKLVARKNKFKKKVNFCNSSYINHCDTRAFFLSPLKKKTVIQKEKVDFKNICRVL